MGRRIESKSLLLVSILMGMAFLARTQSVQDEQFDARLRQLLDFSVPTIDVARAHDEKDQFIFLDARELEEYRVSHIEDAIHVGYRRFRIEALSGLPKDTPLVVYCSVGYRSERIGQRLMEEGYSTVYNLYGSLFEWVNRGHEVVNQSGTATSVHTYNKRWSKWLTRPGVEKTW